MAAEPSSGLSDGESVAVNAGGFAPGAAVVAAQCWATRQTFRGLEDCAGGDGSPLGIADARGEIRGTFIVRRHLLVRDELVDCASPTSERKCYLAAASIADLEQSGAVGLAFDNDAVRMDTSPTVDLADAQTISITGSGLPPGAKVEARQCRLLTYVSDASCQRYSPATVASADQAGSLSMPFVVARLAGSPADGMHDCATEGRRCYLMMRIGQQTFHSTLTFDPDSPAPPPPPPLPIALVQFDQPTPFGTLATYSFSGYPTGTDLQVTGCPEVGSPLAPGSPFSLPSEFDCSPEFSLPEAGGAALNGELFLSATVSSPFGLSSTCTDQQRCVLQLFSGRGSQNWTAPAASPVGATPVTMTWQKDSRTPAIGLRLPAGSRGSVRVCPEGVDGTPARCADGDTVALQLGEDRTMRAENDVSAGTRQRCASKPTCQAIVTLDRVLGDAIVVPVEMT